MAALAKFCGPPIFWGNNLVLHTDLMCIVSISLLVRHDTWSKRRVHWQLQMVYTQTSVFGFY